MIHFETYFYTLNKEQNPIGYQQNVKLETILKLM